MSQEVKQQKTSGFCGAGTAQFLKNQQFAYLFDANDNNDNNEDKVTTISITPSLLTSNNNQKNGYYKQRISSVQVSTTKTQNEQLNAIKKEVEYFESELPFFKDIYSASKQQWSSSNRHKADSETFIFIQALTQWIYQYGYKAVKDYNEFKQFAEKEILAMAKSTKHLTLENKRLKLLIQDGEHEKREMNQEIQENERIIIKYKKKEEERKEDRKTEEIQQNTMQDLENELIEIKRENKILIEKYERVKNYWKMTQAQNDELRNKNYGIKEEIEKLRDIVRAKNSNMNQMQIRHQNTLKTLQLEHENYAQQMQVEQEKLMAAQLAANQNTSQMAPTAAEYIIDADDTDIGGSDITDDNDDFADIGGVISLENEINVYQYDEDDDWLDDTDSDLEDEWETKKTSDYQDIARRDIGFSYSKMQSVKNKKMGLMMSRTGVSCTPQMASTMTKNGAFASETTGTMGQENELIHKNNIPKPLKKVIYIDRGPKKENKLMSGGKNCAAKGGKPQILDQGKAYAMISKWQDKNANNNRLTGNPLNKNIHVTKSTVHRVNDSKNRAKRITVLKITKTKRFILFLFLSSVLTIIFKI